MPKEQSKKVRWEEMLPDDLLAEIERCGVCYCPFGLAEPHGPYNALGLDWIKPISTIHPLMSGKRESGGNFQVGHRWAKGETVFPWQPRPSK